MLYNTLILSVPWDVHCGVNFQSTVRGFNCAALIDVNGSHTAKSLAAQFRGICLGKVYVWEGHWSELMKQLEVKNPTESTVLKVVWWCDNEGFIITGHPYGLVLCDSSI